MGYELNSPVNCHAWLDAVSIVVIPIQRVVSHYSLIPSIVPWNASNITVSRQARHHASHRTLWWPSCRLRGLHRSTVLVTNIVSSGRLIHLILFVRYAVAAVSTKATTNLKLEHETKPVRSATMIDVRFSNLTTTTTTKSASTTTAVPPSECGVNRGCFADKHGNILTYSTTSDGLDVQFEITCKQQDTAGWCSVGFSNTNSMVRSLNSLARYRAAILFCLSTLSVFDYNLYKPLTFQRLFWLPHEAMFQLMSLSLRGMTSLYMSRGSDLF